MSNQEAADAFAEKLKTTMKTKESKQRRQNTTTKLYHWKEEKQISRQPIQVNKKENTPM